MGKNITSLRKKGHILTWRALHWMIYKSSHVDSRWPVRDTSFPWGEYLDGELQNAANPLTIIHHRYFLCDWGYCWKKSQNLFYWLWRTEEEIAGLGDTRVCSFLLPVKAGIWGEKARYGMRRTDYKDDNYE